MLNFLIQFLKNSKNKIIQDNWLVNGHWILLKDNGQNERFVFENNGELIISNQGNISHGKWRNVSNSNSLIIESENFSTLFNYYFSTNSVIILEIDGRIGEYITIVNKNLLPELNPILFLRNYIYKINNVSTGRLADGRTIEIHKFNSDYIFPGQIISIDGEIPADGEYLSQSTRKLYEVKDGKIFKISKIPSSVKSSKLVDSYIMLYIAIAIIAAIFIYMINVNII